MSWLSSIGSGISKAWNKTKDFVSSPAGGTTLGLLTGGIGLAADIYNSYKQNEFAEDNLDFQKDAFKQQTYFSNNQQQINAADAQKAGINPLAMNGQTLSSGSYSNVESPGIDSSNTFAVLGLLRRAKEFDSELDLRRDSLRQQKELEDERNKTNLRIAELEASTKKSIADDDRKESGRQFDSYLSENHSQALSKIELDKKRIQNETTRLLDEKSRLDAQNALTAMETAKTKVDLKASCYDFVKSYVTGYKGKSTLSQALQNIGLDVAGKYLDMDSLAKSYYKKLTGEDW